MPSITSARLLKILSCFFVALLVLTQFGHVQAGPGPISQSTSVISSTIYPAVTVTPRPTSTATPRPTSTATPRPTSTPDPIAAPRITSTPAPTATPAPGNGIVNGSFGLNGNCSLAGWTTSGSVQAVLDDKGNCSALISASAAMRSGQDSTVVSVLEQTFLVNPARPGVGFYVHPFSDNPGTDFPAQTITLTDREGRIIYQGSRNITSPSPSSWWQVGYVLTNYANDYVTLTIEVSIEADNPRSPGEASLRIDFDTPDPWNNPSPDISPPGGW